MDCCCRFSSLSVYSQLDTVIEAPREIVGVVLLQFNMWDSDSKVTLFFRSLHPSDNFSLDWV
jgi:hypothetical protein